MLEGNRLEGNRLEGNRLEGNRLEGSAFQPSQRTDLERIAKLIFEDADAAATEGAAVRVAH